MDHTEARAFAEEWEAAWNSHDLDRILEHYAEDVVFESPYVVERTGKASGVVEGKAELRAYWSAGLGHESQSQLHFTVEDVRLSVNTIVISYRNHIGMNIAEVLRFRDGRVVWGCGAYAQPV